MPEDIGGENELGNPEPNKCRFRSGWLPWKGWEESIVWKQTQC